MALQWSSSETTKAWIIPLHSQKSVNSTNVRKDKQRLLALTLTPAQISFITILTWTLRGTTRYATCVTFVWKYQLKKLYQNSDVWLSSKIKSFSIQGIYFSLFIEPNLLLYWIWLASPFLQLVTVCIIVCHILTWFCKRKNARFHFTPGLEENTKTNLIVQY